MEQLTIQGIAAVISEITGVDGLGAGQDFYEAGVTSVQSLPLLMELESRFDVAIPDSEFIQARTLEALLEMMQRLRASV